MNVIFFRMYPAIDGSLTYSMRLAAALAKEGHRSFFVLSTTFPEALKKQLSDIAPTFYTWELDEAIKNKDLPTIDAVHAGVDGDGINLIYDYKRKYFPNAAIVFGAWASNAFIHTSKLGFSPDGLFYKKFLSKVPARNITFMSPTIRDKHERFAGRNFQEGPVIPNSLELPTQYSPHAWQKKNLLVSIGRLTYSKEYVLSTVDVLKELREEGIHYEFHLYGAGEYLDQLKEKVARENIDFVYLHGEIAYAQVSDALAGAKFFIGMGAAIIEAAAVGVPSLQAIEYEKKPVVYGWFHDLTDAEIGEYRIGKPVIDVKPLLRSAANWTVVDYEAAARKSFERAQTFSIKRVIFQYIDFLKNADHTFILNSSKGARLLRKILRQPFKLVHTKPAQVIAR